MVSAENIRIYEKMTKRIPSWILFYFLLLYSTSFVLGQQAPKAVLVDEFGALPCEFLLAKTDSFAIDLQNEPHSTAYILINHDPERPQFAESRRTLISTTLQMRGIEPDRFSFYMGERNNLHTGYWKIPPGGDLPDEKATLWNEPRLDTSRAFIFGVADELNICPTFVPRAFAKLILENPGSHGRIVIETVANSLTSKWSFAEEWIDELVERQKLPRHRIRLIFVNSKTNSKDFTSATFWFVPHKRK